jgi:simple sugar transport system permease protein
MTATAPPAESTSTEADAAKPPEIDGWIGSVVDRATRDGLLSTVLVPILSVIAALIVGAALIAFDGSNPLEVYHAILRGVFTKNRGFSDTATAATPLILIGIGYAIAYRARVFTIGGEGQYLVGAVAGTALVTAGGVRDLPGPVLIVLGLLAAVVAGALWSGLAGWLGVRFGASIVISTLMLGFVGDSILQWAVRDGIRDPDSFIANSRLLGDAELPSFFGQNTHLGFLFALLIVPIAWWFIARHRAGFRIDAVGHNPAALDANEFRAAKIVIGVMLVAGGLAGLAGMVETAGVNGRLGQEASVGFGWDAIIVALLGRLHPLGVLIAGLGMAGLTIGFESSQRELALPSSLVSLITALIVIFVVFGDALATRLKERR